MNRQNRNLRTVGFDPRAREKKEDGMRWKLGDEVQLISSGPNMAVLDVSDEGVRCRWFDKSGKLHEETFPDETLIKAEPSQLTIIMNLGDDPPKQNT